MCLILSASSIKVHIQEAEKGLNCIPVVLLFLSDTYGSINVLPLHYVAHVLSLSVVERALEGDVMSIPRMVSTLAGAGGHAAAQWWDDYDKLDEPVSNCWKKALDAIPFQTVLWRFRFTTSWFSSLILPLTHSRWNWSSRLASEIPWIRKAWA